MDKTVKHVISEKWSYKEFSFALNVFLKVWISYLFPVIMRKKDRRTFPFLKNVEMMVIKIRIITHWNIFIIFGRKKIQNKIPINVNSGSVYWWECEWIFGLFPNYWIQYSLTEVLSVRPWSSTKIYKALPCCLLMHTSHFCSIQDSHFLPETEVSGKIVWYSTKQSTQNLLLYKLLWFKTVIPILKHM